MNRIILIVFLACLSLVSNAQTSEKNDVTTFYLITHAESDSNTDTLSPKGINRANNWVNVFSDTKLDVVYVTTDNCSKQTAHPTAKTQKAGVFSLEPTQQYDGGFKYNTDGKNILIVGNSKELTRFGNLIGNSNLTINNDDFSNVYVITVTNAGTTQITLKVN